jgi:flagellin
MAQENLRVNSEFQGRTITRLTSGYRINSSGDDAAGLSVANKFRSDVSELQQGVRNRLKTLATQSASSTFSGDRTILNTEYQALLTEIDRQASNIGLSVGAHGGRFNTDIGVYVGGGGAAQDNSKVAINLGGASNRADSAGLGLSGTSIAGGGATSISNSVDMSTATDLLDASATQDFVFHISKAGGPAFTTTITVTGDADGLTGAEVVGQLNSALNQHGISASLNSSNGTLQFSGDVAFTASATDNGDLFTANGTVSNGAMYTAAGQATYAAPAAGAETVTLTVGTASATATIGTTATLAQALETMNDAFRGLGVHAVLNAAGTGIDLQSSADFSLTASSTTAAQGVFGTDGAQTVTDPSASGSATSAAEAAITELTSAVSYLGAIQGKVGTAQNKLQYAVQLAQSQISNFSAAESRIRDADVASEASNLTKAQVLQQASLAAMAQANSAPQAVLSLLRG